MADADTLWTAVVSSYASSLLIELTNQRDPSATAIETTVGTAAAQAIIDLWPMYVQSDFDVTDARHLQVAILGTVAMLYRRGGAASEVEQAKWNEVFGSDGLAAKLRSTDPRARSGPASNSDVASSNETIGGRRVLGWSDRRNLPANLLPPRRVNFGFGYD